MKEGGGGGLGEGDQYSHIIFVTCLIARKKMSDRQR